MTAYDFKSSNTQGPITFGPLFSGSGAVKFGGNAPGATSAAVDAVTSSPIIFIGLAVAAVLGLWIMYRR